jgi:hypothetical protein
MSPPAEEWGLFDIATSGNLRYDKANAHTDKQDTMLYVIGSTDNYTDPPEFFVG